MIDHPFITVYAICALVILAAAALAALGQTGPGPTNRPPIRRAARRTPHRAAGYAAQNMTIPAPRTAPDTTTTITATLHEVTDRSTVLALEEIHAALGCTCSPRLRGDTTMTQTSHNGPQRIHLIADRNEQHVAHSVATEYEISYLTPVLDAETGLVEYPTTSLLFAGPTAEDDAYAVADLISAGQLAAWAMRTRTVETAITRSPWIDVAGEHTGVDDIPHRIENGICTACAAENVRYGSDQS